MPALDYYRILGLSCSATLEEVRRRYRRLVRKYHPDRNPDDPDAAAYFRRVVAAYEAIQSAGARSRAAAQNYRQPRFTGREPLFAELFGIFAADAPLPRSGGANFRYDLQIPLTAAIKGMDTVIEVDRMLHCLHCRATGVATGAGYRSCPDCQGRGRLYGGPGLLRFGPRCDRCQGRGRIAAQPCRHCHGQGFSPARQQYPVHIPPGIEDGSRLRFTGEGGEGFHYGPPGNLEVVIHVAPDDFFTRVGNDLHCQVRVSFAEAALGGAIRIPTLDGYRTVNLPPGTQTGWTFRFMGAGGPGGSHRPPGDQVNEVVVTTPQDLTPRQRELLEELALLQQGEVIRAEHE